MTKTLKIISEVLIFLTKEIIPFAHLIIETIKKYRKKDELDY